MLRQAGFAALLLLLASGAAHAETRCGWFENPTPANAWLNDKDGQWIISTQGQSAEDVGDWPHFSKDQWIQTNAGSYGYGCACMDVVTDAREHRILKIISSRAMSQDTCHADMALDEPENPLED